MEKGRVCVTGAGGYVASWVVKLFLSEGYIVHGTVRDPDNAKNAHLKKLDNAAENLQLFKAELLDYDSIYAAIAGCNGVIHVACPVPFPNGPSKEIDIVEPSVTGTQNVLKACSAARVKRVVVVSSIVTVMMNPNWPQDRVMDENCWSDMEYCKKIENVFGWYCLAKTAAEREALEYGEKSELEVVTVCAAWIIGPLLQPSMNCSSMIFTDLLKGFEEIENDFRGLIVDVRDIAEALLLVYEKQKASGRYICLAHSIGVHDLVEKLRSMYPNYNYPMNYMEAEKELKMSSEKLKRLGWKYRSLEETLADTVGYFQEAGLLDKD
ncbi:cinnamoyl-CoA reductase 2-like [Tasmannia lanceolata]|uniref:cinnamoyl-CoA reductase 2-like n=1 Tax=Tasmannia lanceolata TaxID=3420 RepID=UPI0040644772